MTMRRTTVFALVAASVVVNLSLVMWSGITAGMDMKVFRSGADHLLAGQPLEGKEPGYVAYSAVLALCRLAGIGEWGAVALQIAVAAAATVAACALGYALAGPAGGALSAAFWVFNVDVARWHAYLLTDSLYMSLVVIATCLVHDAVGRASWRYGVAIAATLGAALLRPNGWLLMLIAAIYWIARASIGTGLKWASSGLAMLLFVGILMFAGPFRSAIEREQPETSLKQGVVIWNFDGWRVAMPAEPGEEDRGLPGLVAYAARHPFATARLALTRVGAELAHVRPFYSRAHNVLLLVVLIPVYPLAVMGGWRLRRQPLVALMAAVIASDLLIVAATFADWDGRFLLHTFQLIAVLAACEAALRHAPPAATT